MLRRPRLAAAGALAVATLAGAGVAAASHKSQTTQQASATFAAAAVSQSRSSTCTSSDGVYQDTTATYTGTSTSGDGRLNGPATIRVRSILNTTTQLGWLSGSFKVQSSAGPSSSADIDGALAGGKVTGFLRGTNHRSDGQLMASFSASFTPGGGFTSGQLGTGSTNNTGVFFTSGSCTQTKRFSATAVFHVGLNPNEVVPPVSGLRAAANGSVTFDLARDTSGAITGGNAVFYLNYDFRAAVTLTGLSLHQGDKGSNGPAVLDASIGTVNDSDGGGNVTKVVTGVSASVLQAVLGNPHGYYITLTTSTDPNGALRDQLENPQKR
jgi:hypothetical protein